MRQAVARIYALRPSLSQGDEHSEAIGTQARFKKLEELNAQVLKLQNEIAQQMLDLKASIVAVS